MPKSYQIQCTHNNNETVQTPNMDILDAKAVFFDCQFKEDINKIELLHNGKVIFRAVKYEVRDIASMSIPVAKAWRIEEVK